MRLRAFEDVTFTWEGKDYTIKADRILDAIVRIEDVVTLDKLSRHFNDESVPRARLAKAFGAVLRYAGAKTATDDDVYVAMFKEDAQTGIVAAVTCLLAMMMPPHLDIDDDAPRENPPRRAARASSKNSTRSSSAKVG